MIIVLIGNGHWRSDLQNFFGPLRKEDRVYRFRESKKKNVLLRDLGLASSASEAHRNGFEGEIISGYSELQYGRHFIGILKVFEPRWYIRLINKFR